MTAEMTKMHWLGAVMASASDKGEIKGNGAALREAFDLGKKSAAPQQ
jgi:hypothetical protein